MRAKSPFQFLLQCGPWLVVALWFFGLVAIGLQLVMPMQVGYLTNLFARGDSVSLSKVNSAILLMVGAQLLVSGVRFAQARLTVELQERLILNLVLALFKRVLRFPAEYFHEHDVEAVNARLLDDTRVAGGFWLQSFVNVPVELVTLTAYAGYMIWHNWFLGVCMIPMALLNAYFLIFDRQIQQLKATERTAWEKLRSTCYESVSQVGELRNHAAFEYAAARIGRRMDGYRNVSKRLGVLSGVFEAFGPLVGTIQTSTLYYIGAVLCLSNSSLAQLAGQMTWGEVVQFLLVVLLFNRPVGVIARYLLQWRLTRQNRLRVEELAAQELGFPPSSGAARSLPVSGEVVFDSISVCAPNRMMILHEVSLAAPAGHHMGIVGPSGSGKSTLVGALVRDRVLAAGHIRVGGVELTQIDIEQLARFVAILPQRPAIIDESIRDNLLLGLRRISEHPFTDESGGVDLTDWPEIRNRDDLEELLVHTIRRVGLGGDLLRMGLGCFAPTSAKQSDRFSKVRQFIAEALKRDGVDLVAPFDEERYLDVGQLGENLLGVGKRATGCTAEDWRRLEQAAREFDLENELLELGLASGALNKIKAGSLSPWQAQIAAALELDARRAADLVESPSFTARIVQARKRFTNHPGTQWPGQQLLLREHLVGGRPDTRRYGAVDRLDRLIETALDEYQLSGAVVSIGLNVSPGERGKRISGGQQQKLALARILLKKPQVLILDEATASLDERSQAEIVRLIAEEFRECTVLIVSHRLQTVAGTDGLWVLDRGRVVQQGTYEELSMAPGLFRDLLRGDPHAEENDPHNAADLQRGLQQCVLLKGLGAQNLERLASSARRIDCAEGTVLFRRGEPGDDLFLILSGEVEFFVGKEPSVKIVGKAITGETFGELAILGAELRSVGVRAVTDVKLASIDKVDFLAVLDDDPLLGRRLLKTVATYAARLASDVYMADGPAPSSKRLQTITP